MTKVGVWICDGCGDFIGIGLDKIYRSIEVYHLCDSCLAALEIFKSSLRGTRAEKSQAIYDWLGSLRHDA